MPAAGAERRKLCEQCLLLHGAGGVEQAPSRAMRTERHPVRGLDGERVRKAELAAATRKPAVAQNPSATVLQPAEIS